MNAMGSFQTENPALVETIPIDDTSEGSSAITITAQERYTHWKKNAKLLYEYLNTNSTKWPSLTCQFFPDIDSTTDTHRILLSAFTSSQLVEDESLYISKISTLNHLNWASLNNFDMDEMEFKPNNAMKLPSKNLTTEISIRFPSGDCNRARYMPHNPDLIACASSDSSVYLFNKTKHGSLRKTEQDKTYEIQFSSPNNEANETTSLAWNWQDEGILSSCYSGGQLRVWDIKAYNKNTSKVDQPVWSADFDALGSNDVSWLPTHDSVLATCGESNIVALWDLRTREQVLQSHMDTHTGGINACRFHNNQSLLLASADSQGQLNLWDIRKLDANPIRTLNHGSSISTIEWNPAMGTIIATASQDDGIVKLWDVASGEVIFVHAGHMLGVTDIAWDWHDPWLMCSVANDNSVQIWKPASNIVRPKEC